MTVAPSATSNGLRAIIGDANAVDANLLQIFLKSMYAEIVCEQSGQALLAAVAGAGHDESVFDVVILNRTLRGQDGIETARLLREGGYTGTIIGTTSELNRELEDKWTVAGANAFLTKPISGDELIATIVGSVGRE